MFANPKKNIAQLGLREGMRVADFGAGAGHYLKPLSEQVGITGKVYGIEVQKDMVKKLESQIKEWGISNVECIWGDIERDGGTKIAKHSMDAVVVSNVLFQVSDKLGLIDEVKRVLKPDAKVLLVDWSESFNGMGPAPMHVVSEKQAEDLFEGRGFILTEKISSSDHHYGIIFTYKG